MDRVKPKLNSSGNFCGRDTLLQEKNLRLHQYSFKSTSKETRGRRRTDTNSTLCADVTRFMETAYEMRSRGIFPVIYECQDGTLHGPSLLRSVNETTYCGVAI
jgi:hypothetical protein